MVTVLILVWTCNGDVKGAFSLARGPPQGFVLAVTDSEEHGC